MTNLEKGTDGRSYKKQPKEWLIENIVWDTEQEDGEFLDARELGLPQEVRFIGLEEKIEDHLSDTYDYCTLQYHYRERPGSFRY